MYPRNAASPPRIAIGAVVQISDGAVQTSGCTVRVIEQGGAEGDGAGTTAYSTDGVVLYTPTQAETDQIAFVVIAKKTGCIPVSQTIITSASDVTGYGGVDWSKVNAPTTTLALTGTTIATTQKVDVETIKTQTVTAAAGVTFPSSIASPTNITAGTITTVTNLTNLPAITANWLTAAGIDASAVTELQSGLSTLDAAGIRSALGLASANLDTQFAALPTADENADALIARNIEGGSSTGRTVAQALAFLRNKWTVSGGALTVYAADDAATSWTAAVTQTAGNPISAVDPT